MRTIIRDDYTPELGQYHERIIIDPVKEKTWLFDCDGVFLDITKVFVANEYGDNKEHAISQDFFTKEVQQMAEDLSEEEAARIAADEDLQDQIDTIKAASDVVDIVGTYAELLAYDTSTLTDSDIIKVLADENHENATTYYRWMAATSSWSYIGEQGPYYTQTEVDNLLDEKQDTLIAGHGIEIASDSKTISAGTLFYCSTTLVGSLYNDPDWDWYLDFYKDSALTEPVTAEDMVEAMSEGEVIINIGPDNYASVQSVADEPETGVTYATIMFNDITGYGTPYTIYMGYYYGDEETSWNVLDFFATEATFATGEIVPGLPIKQSSAGEVYADDFVNHSLVSQYGATHSIRGDVRIPTFSSSSRPNGVFLGTNTYPKYADNVPLWSTEGVLAAGTGADARGKYLSQGSVVRSWYPYHTAIGAHAGADLLGTTSYSAPTFIGAYAHSEMPNSNLSRDWSVAIGYNSVSTRIDEVSFGSGSVLPERAYTTRYLANVKAGTLDTDAVNVGQLNTAIASITPNNISSADWSALWQ